MRQVLVMIMLLALVLSVGCNKNEENNGQLTTENISETLDVESTTEIVPEITTTADVEPIPEMTEADLNAVELDAYTSVSVPIEYDPNLFDAVEAEIITETSFIVEIEDYLKDFYFNYYFLNSLEEETGTVTAQSMELFALSYIMQNENQELKFDVDTFRLYIPVNHVRTTVAKYFHRNLDVYNSYEDLGILYEKDMYSIIVEDGTWDVDFKVTSIAKMGDFSYRVEAEAVDADYDVVREQIEVIVDETADGFLVVNYHVTEVTLESNTEE